MRIAITPVLIAGITVLIASIVVLYLSIFLFPNLMEEYYHVVFRSSSFDTDWLFYAHPFILSLSLQLFWDKFKGDASEAAVVRAFKVAVIYGLVAILPVLWLTFSAIDISMIMVFTWLVYGILQAFIATLVFTRMIP